MVPVMPMSPNLCDRLIVILTMPEPPCKNSTKIYKTNQAQQQIKSGFQGWRATMAGLAGSIYTIRSALSAAGSITNIVDEYTLTTAKLNLINDGLQTTAQLQTNIFRAAQASRGSYTDMAAAVSKLGMLAGDAFASNVETTKFTELMQKSFMLGGASTAEQQSGMYQLTQAMAAGKLQGDEFRSIMENAPLLAQAIADFTGKSKGELKELSSEGLITADIIKGALFAMSDEINEQFESLPQTFGSVMQSMKNQMLMGSQGIVNQLAAIADSDSFAALATSAVQAANKVVGVLGWVIRHIRGISTALGTGLSFWAAYKIGTGVATVALTLFSGAAQLGIAKTGGMGAALVGYSGSAIGATGATTGLSGAVHSLNAAMAANPIGMVAMALSALVGIIGASALAYRTAAQAATEAANANLLYFQSLGIVNGLPQDAKISSLEKNASKTLGGLPALRGAGKRTNTHYRESMTAISGLEKGKNAMADWLQSADDAALKSMLSYVSGKSTKGPVDLKSWGLADADKGSLIEIVRAAKLQRDIDNFDTGISGIPDVPDVGTVAQVDKINTDINIADESLKYLVDGVTRQYVNKINLQTVQPNISVEFSGPIKETADVNGISERIIAEAMEKMQSSTDLAYNG